MADQNAKSYLIGIKFSTQSFFEVANYKSELNIQEFKKFDWKTQGEGRRKE